MTFRIQLGRWAMTQAGLFRLTEHRDAKTNGQKARWQQWDQVFPR